MTQQDLVGKVMLLTGATEGIGLAAARAFTARGATLTLVGRNRDKTERVCAALRAQGGKAEIDFIVADLSKLADVRAVAAEFKKRRDRLDVLVNNAGAMFERHMLSADGFEMTFALNHLGYFLLTRELLGMLGPGGRIVSTASAAHRGSKLDLDTVAKRPDGKAGFAAYCDSKLCNILFTRELARRTADRGIVPSSFHPGFVRSGFGMGGSKKVAVAIRISGALFARSPEKGADTMVWLAADPDPTKERGEYFHDRKVGRATSRSKDPELAQKLWAYSESLVG
jgi:NAD(P)-dependent dehydrogenase (short-subunit alcohol dehydrogenase family)